MSDNPNIGDKQIGQPVDGKIVITIGDNAKDAFLTIYHAENGGRQVTTADVSAELAAKGIRYGIDYDAISRAVESRTGVNYRIAKGLAPVDGEDGTITYHFSQFKTVAPKEDESGYVDYRDLGHIQNITIGTVIATFTPPTQGEPGINIKNVEIRQVPGRPAPYTIGKNTALSGDGLEIVATCDGHLRWESNKFVVDDVVNIKDVDASIGNLDFIGSINIRGEVLEGFKVTSKKNISISGNATGAIIECGGDLSIKLGSINSTITCHGNIDAGFCENSKITCDGTITSNSFVTCDVYCGGELHAKGSKGTILGGKYIVLQDLYANVLGSEAFTPTEVTIGDNAVLTAEKNQAVLKIGKLKEQITMADQIVEILKMKKQQLGSLPPEREEMLTNTTRSKIQYQMEISQLQKRIEEISVYLENKENLSVYVNKTIYPGTKININDFTLPFKDEYHKCRVCLGSDGIVVQV